MATPSRSVVSWRLALVAVAALALPGCSGPSNGDASGGGGITLEQALALAGFETGDGLLLAYADAFFDAGDQPDGTAREWFLVTRRGDVDTAWVVGAGGVTSSRPERAAGRELCAVAPVTDSAALAQWLQSAEHWRVTQGTREGDAPLGLGMRLECRHGTSYWEAASNGRRLWFTPDGVLAAYGDSVTLGASGLGVEYGARTMAPAEAEWVFQTWSATRMAVQVAGVGALAGPIMLVDPTGARWDVPWSQEEATLVLDPLPPTAAEGDWTLRLGEGVRLTGLDASFCTGAPSAAAPETACKLLREG